MSIEPWCYLILPLGTFIYWIYTYVKDKQQFWAIRGVGGPAPLWGIGHMYERTFSNMYEYEIECMRKHGKFYGLYMTVVPALWIIDKDLIKQVLVKDFQYFVNRADVGDTHELWDKNMLSAKDENWRRVRTICSPSFTSGKLKAMSSTMALCVDNLVTHLERLIAEEGGILQTKDVIQSAMMDVISRSAFAQNLNVYDKANNEVLKNGKKFFELKPFRLLAFVFLPKFIREKVFDIRTFFDPTAFEFFINLTKHVIEERKRRPNPAANDLLQLLLDAAIDEEELTKTANYQNLNHLEVDGETEEKGETPISSEPSANSKKLTDTEIIANCIVVLVAGFETTSSVLSHCILELTRNGEIQERLHREVAAVLGDVQPNSPEYIELVNSGIPYLEAVLKETLRKYPPVGLLTRTCNNEQYRLNGVHIGKMLIGIPVTSLHNCEEYWPEPEKFKPDRFMPESKHLIQPYTYLPFGAGPRNCVGMRFALQEMRLCLAKLCYQFHFEATANTPEKLSYQKGNTMLNAPVFSVKVSRR